MKEKIKTKKLRKFNKGKRQNKANAEKERICVRVKEKREKE